jgi:hypothetical protein
MIIVCTIGLFGLAWLARFAQTRAQVPQYQRVAARTLRPRHIH